MYNCTDSQKFKIVFIDRNTNEKWQDLMSPYFEIPEGDHADKNMLELKQVFHTD